MLAVAQNHVSNVSDTQAVHQHAAGGHLAGDGKALLAHLDYLADFGDDDVLAGRAEAFSQLGVLPQLGILAVDGNKILRLAQHMQQLDFLLAGVARNVHLAQLAVDDVCAAAVKLVDDARHRLLVAGNGGGGDDYHVGRSDLQLAVLAVRHAG